MQPLSDTSYPYTRSQRLLKPSDFKQVFDAASVKINHQKFLILASKTHRDFSRLGFVIAKKYASRAVQRNRIKRISRELFRLSQNRLVGLDIVLLPRQKLNGLSDARLQLLLQQQWQKLIDFQSKT